MTAACSRSKAPSGIKRLWMCRTCGARELGCGTYDDGDGGGSAEDLLHQAVSVIQRLHDLPLALGHLEQEKHLLFSKSQQEEHKNNMEAICTIIAQKVSKNII